MEGIIQSSGFRIYTKVEGTGKPVLLLHSLWGSQALFDSLAGYLAQEYKVIRLDFPGHGNSPSYPGDFTFVEFAPIIDQILDQLNIEEKITLVGHSMGGFAALAYSEKYSNKVASLCLIHSLAQKASPSSIVQRMRQAELIRQNRKKLLLQYANESNFAPGNSRKFPEYFHQLELISNLVTDQGALSAIYAINSREDGLTFLSKAGFPILIVIGEKDKIYDPSEQLREHENIPGSEVLILSDSGHMGFCEEEETFNKNLRSFLMKTNGRSH
jgi:pimeloyl-ACP methyl ester carboxylesterase